VLTSFAPGLIIPDIAAEGIVTDEWQPIDTVENFSPREPGPATLAGWYVLLEPLDDSHATSLFEALGNEDQGLLQRYTADAECTSLAEIVELIEAKRGRDGSAYFAFVDHFNGKALGYGALMRAYTEHRTIELGNLLFTSGLRRKRGGTEAVYLMLRHAFEDLGYRRVEWKCNNLNMASRNAALRYGFSFEGVFRQHMIVRGENRDSAWFSMLDQEWPSRRAALETWLEPGNFDAYGTQFTSLSKLNGVGGS